MENGRKWSWPHGEHFCSGLHILTAIYETVTHRVQNLPPSGRPSIGKHQYPIFCLVSTINRIHYQRILLPFTLVQLAPICLLLLILGSFLTIWLLLEFLHFNRDFLPLAAIVAVLVAVLLVHRSRLLCRPSTAFSFPSRSISLPLPPLPRT